MRRPVIALPSCGCARQPSIICPPGLITAHGHHSSPFPRLHSQTSYRSLFPAKLLLGVPLCPLPALAAQQPLPTGRGSGPGQGRGLGPRGPEPGGAEASWPRPRPAPGPATRAPPRAGPGGRSQVFAGARMSELWLRSGSGSLRSLRAGLPAHPEPRGAPATLPAARPPSSQPPSLGGAPHPAESLTRPLSRCPQLRSGRCSLSMPPPRFLPRQLCPGRPAALDRTPFLPSFILSGNSHSSSACDVPRTRPIRPSECGPRPAGVLREASALRPILPAPPRPASLSSLMSYFTHNLAFNSSLLISPVKCQSVARSRRLLVTKIRDQSESRVRSERWPELGFSQTATGFGSKCGWELAAVSLWPG